MVDLPQSYYVVSYVLSLAIFAQAEAIAVLFDDDKGDTLSEVIWSNDVLWFVATGVSVWLVVHLGLKGRVV